jgi:hyaluronan synthase
MIGYLLSAISLCYIIYIYALLIARKETEYPDYKRPVTIVIPCYNEEPKALRECIESILSAKGEKQIILVDNNSTRIETRMQILDFVNKYSTDIQFASEKRQGKRFAHSKGLQYAKHDIVVFVDSDTIIDKNALIELVKPFQDKSIGGVTGQIKVANRENIISKSLSAMFWSSFNLMRKASTTMGYMQVASGALCAYRKSDLILLEKDYLNQKFLGRPCAISDDRFLTTRVQLKLNKNVAYQEKAVAYTYVPTTFKKTWKMIERWKRGALREVILMWSQKFWRKQLLMFDNQYNLFMTSTTLILKTFMIYNLIFHFNLINLAYTLFWFVLVSTLYSSLMIVENIKELPYKLIWSLMYEFFFVFTFVQALLKIRHQSSWATR